MLSSLVQLQCEVFSLTLCSWVFSGFRFRYIYPCLHNQPLQVRSYSVKFFLSPFRCCRAWCSYSVKFPLSPFRCCQAWYSYNVKSFLSLTLCFWVLAWYSYSVKFFFSCCQPTNIKYHLLQSESDWSRLLLSICWLGLVCLLPVETKWSKTVLRNLPRGCFSKQHSGTLCPY